MSIPIVKRVLPNIFKVHFLGQISTFWGDNVNFSHCNPREFEFCVILRILMYRTPRFVKGSDL